MSLPQFLGILTLTTSLTACSIFIQSPPSAPPSDQLTQTCQNLKQDIALAPTENALHQDGYTPAKDAKLYKEYEENHCDTILSDNRTIPIKPTR